MIDFTPWDELLHRYVDDRGRVDYARWNKEAAGTLTQWLDRLSALDLSAYPDANQRLALWLNLYNALTIAQVLARYPIDSIRPKRFGIPNWWAFFWFFQRPVYEMGGQRYSLNAIEHGILRPTFRDPRIHFALVCASIGCPWLRNEAYQPETVQTQLEADAVRFINNPAKVYYDAETQTLYCSKIFKWYQQDFLKVAPSIPAYVRAYLSPPILLEDLTPIRYLHYDWNLNQRISS